MAISHLYTPASEICHVVNDRFFGRYSLTDLPTYWQPTPEGIAFADRLIERAIAGSDVKLIIGDPSDYNRADFPDTEPWREAYETGLRAVTGPKGLEAELSVAPEFANLLWDRGPEDRILTLAGISKA